MLNGTYFIAMTVSCEGNKIWEDVYFKSEEKAMKAAEDLSEAYGGRPVVEAVEW